MSYQVFIERPRDTAPDSVERLASAIGHAYGMPAGALAQHLAAGRLRVKSGVDRATAERFVAELERLGAVCSIEDASGRPLSALPQPAHAATPRPATPPPVPAATPYSATPPPLPAATPRPGQDPVGLAAALGPNVANQDLGALSTDMPSFALATLDGETDEANLAPPAIAFEQSDGTTRTVTKKDDRVPAMDEFAPPEQAEPSLQLAVDPRQLNHRAAAPARAPLAQPAAPAAAMAPGPALAADSAHARPLDTQPRALARRVAHQLATRPRLRFAVGVAVAIVLGFIPAHVVSAVREGAAFQRIDRAVVQEQNAIEQEPDPAARFERWEGLEEFRRRKLADKASQQQGIALMGVLIWALAGGGLALLWFRKLDWTRLASGAAPPR